MALIDEMKIVARAGKGGDGVVRWRHEKSKPLSGPAGGNGGKGGNVYVRAVRDIFALAQYRHQNGFFAEAGESGRSGSEHGKNGEHLYIDLPLGSVITNTKTKESVSLIEDGQIELLLEGGNGGYGNEHFKASTNTTPLESTPGKPGEEGTFFIELELFADLGLVGLPNAGKSSLLNALTNATAKIGDYQFTTLDPNLGALYEFVVADIPGLIEGASEGKGLGTKFLRHIKRTKMIAHLVSFENADMMATYETIRNELSAHDSTLIEKNEIIILTKTDTVDEARVAEELSRFKTLGKEVLVLSLFDDESVKIVRDALVRLLRGE